MLILNTTFLSNTASAGGALYNRLFNFALNPMFIKTSTFKFNLANGSTDAHVGGAIASTQPVDIRESSFENNLCYHDVRPFVAEISRYHFSYLVVGYRVVLSTRSLT